ncbi:hypothetical protein OHS33_31760 [Streptomyces sp. NBC_00536]|uniref:hypothetical protein n=1 Tax=Streptomyces sp. NBC_00536 TaxID=2975769 RepID=UPI002E80E0C7|nr:hypothetical protein [Streptomyces sp. NBC_00536]WUC82532.1 hypothetical protein OHS33_31760 [Streptomyces sp. NBC_00536]
MAAVAASATFVLGAAGVSHAAPLAGNDLLAGGTSAGIQSDETGWGEISCQSVPRPASCPQI